MKGIILKIILLEFFVVINSYNSFPQTTIQISSSAIQNAFIDNLYPTTNYAENTEFDAIDWTYQNNPFVSRSLVSYDLSVIPAGSTITNATLSLYGDSSTRNHQGSTGSNACFLQLINSSWNVNTVTWNNQPSTDTADEVSIPQSTSIYENYPNINVTSLISDLYNNPSTYFGLMLRLQDESLYNSMVFGSNTNSDTSIQPKLIITYIPNGSGTEECPIIKEKQYITNAYVDSMHPTTNYADYPEFDAITWTNGGPFILRSVIQFNLSSIPNGSTIDSAILSLYGDSATANYQGDAGNNATYLKRVTSSWNVNTVTWNNQPTTTTTDEVLIPQSTSMYENYPHIDITALINDIYNSSNNYGLVLQLQNETLYTSTVFGSSYNSDSSIWPVLKICYTLPSGLPVINTNDLKWDIYPNPFDNNFTISYNLLETSNVSFELYNIIGQEISTTEIGNEEAGNYQYTIEPNQNLSSGVYFIKAIINNNSLVKEIIKD